MSDSSAAEKGGSKATGSSKDAAGDAGASKKEKKKKSKKKEDNDGMPQIKKPLSAYMLFNNARRPTLQKEYPSKYHKIFQPNLLQTAPCCLLFNCKNGMRGFEILKFEIK